MINFYIKSHLHLRKQRNKNLKGLIKMSTKCFPKKNIPFSPRKDVPEILNIIITELMYRQWMTNVVHVVALALVLAARDPLLGKMQLSEVWLQVCQAHRLLPLSPLN